MERVYILADGGIVTAMQLSAEPLEGWVATNATAIPDTSAEDGCTVEVVWRDGVLLVVQVPIPMPTEEERSEERRKAYEAEADRYLIAMHGYEVEGNTSAAENCRQAYLAKKAEIRARIV